MHLNFGNKYNCDALEDDDDHKNDDALEDDDDHKNDDALEK